MNDYLLVDRDGEVIQYYADRQQHYYTLYIGDTAYEENKNQLSLTWFEYDKNEKVSSIAESGKRILLDTEITDKESLADDAEAVAASLEDVEKNTLHYEIDAESYEILQTFSTFHFQDGTSFTRTSLIRENACEEYILDESIFPDTATLETAILTVVENPGTPEEIALTYSVPADYLCYFVLSSEYDRDVYTDAACTVPLKYNTADPKHQTQFYIRNAG